MAMRAALTEEIRAWLERAGYDTTSPDLQGYLKQWTKVQELDGFALRKPGRWSYFRHLFEFPRVCGRIMSPRQRLYSNVRAFGALLLGYDRLYVLDDFRRGHKAVFAKAEGASVFSEDKKEGITKR
jgi:hypothetical protein